MPQTIASHRSCSPVPDRDAVATNEESPSKRILNDYKALHGDELVTKPLEANVRRREELESKRREEERLEKEKYEREYSERKTFYQKMRA